MLETRLSPVAFLRHGLALLLFVYSWDSLSRWYSFQRHTDYVLFLSLSAAALLLACGSLLLRSFRMAPTKRLILILLFLFLSLPWAEWFHWSNVEFREDWSRQILQQGILLYLGLLLFALFPKLPEAIQKHASSFLEFVSLHRAFFWMPAVLFFFFTAWMALFVQQQTPITPDSAAHLFQAKIFKNLRLFAPAPPLSEFFSIFADMLVLENDRCLNMYQPGFAVLLAGAMIFKAEWLLSPLMGALTIAVWMSYIGRYHGNKTAALFGWLGLFSPFLFLMSSTIMVFTPELFLISATLYLCRLQTEKEQTSRNVLLIVVLAGLILVRFFSSMVFLMP